MVQTKNKKPDICLPAGQPACSVNRVGSATVHSPEWPSYFIEKMNLKNILFVYTFDKSEKMKNLSLKMDEDIFLETERITTRIKKNRNRYINEAVEFYNLLQKRKIISRQLQNESKAVREESMKVLSEFEKLQDED